MADSALFWGQPTYVPWPGVIQLKRQKYEIRITTAPTGLIARITKAILKIDVVDIIETVDDASIAITTGSRLPLVKVFKVIQNVQITLQDDGGDAVGIRIIDKNATFGPLIQCIDADGNAVAGIVDAIVQGF